MSTAQTPENAMAGPDAPRVRSSTAPLRYAVLTTQRSGSTWLMSSLNALPGVTGYFELFLPHYPAKDPSWLVDPHPEGFYGWSRQGRMPRPLSTWRYLSGLPERAPDAAAVGFKVMINQAMRYYPEVLPLLRVQGYRLIVLTRDPLALAISRHFARATGVSHRTDPAALRRVRIDPAWARRDIRKRLLEFRLARHVVRTLGFQAYWVDYAELFDADPTARRGLPAYLGAAGSELGEGSPLVKVVNAPYSEVVENYAELQAIARAEYGEPGPGHAAAAGGGAGR